MATNDDQQQQQTTTDPPPAAVPAGRTTRAARLDFIQRAAANAAALFAGFREAQAIASDFADLYGAELDRADYAARPDGAPSSSLDGFDPAVMAAYVGLLVRIDAIMSADGGAARIAAKRLAMFAGR